MVTKTLIAAALVVFLAAPVLAQEEVDREYGDMIFFLDDDGNVQKVKECKVTSATYEKVMYTQRGGRSKGEKDGSRVLSVAYGDAPRVYQTGLVALTRQQYQKAQEDFEGSKAAVEGGFAGPWLSEYAAVQKGLALVALGQTEPMHLNDAVTEFKAALTANPKSLLYDKIQLGLVKCHSLLEEWDKAKAAAETLSSVGEAIKQPLWKIQGERAVADALLSQKKYIEAVTAFENLVASAQRELKWAKGDLFQTAIAKQEIEAAVAQGWSKVATAEASKSASDWKKAQQYFEGLPQKSDTYRGSDEVAAAVLNGVGRCLLDSDPRAALLKFTEAEVSHFSARNEVARALYLKAKALQKLGGSRNRRMAEQALKDLREFYPGSEWVRK
jgi:tetratricopeptide (TPR) repeat protein